MRVWVARDTISTKQFYLESVFKWTWVLSLDSKNSDTERYPDTGNTSNDFNKHTTSISSSAETLKKCDSSKMMIMEETEFAKVTK